MHLHLLKAEAQRRGLRSFGPTALRDMSVNVDRAIEVTKSVDGEEPGPVQSRFRITDSAVDTLGDRIFSAGMDTDWYERAGSLLWGHRADSPSMVVGRPIEIIRGEGFIDAVFEFLPKGIAGDVGWSVGEMVRLGFVRGSSVGIQILEYSEAHDRPRPMSLDILQSRLFENSITPVPVNDRALKQTLSENEQEGLERALEVALDCDLFADAQEDYEIEVANAYRELQNSSVSVAVPPDP